MTQNFQINSICREDLIEYIREEQAPKLTDKEMETIAKVMGDYMQENYWSCLIETLDKLDIELRGNFEE